MLCMVSTYLEENSHTHTHRRGHTCSDMHRHSRTHILALTHAIMPICEVTIARTRAHTAQRHISRQASAVQSRTGISTFATDRVGRSFEQFSLTSQPGHTPLCLSRYRSNGRRLPTAQSPDCSSCCRVVKHSARLCELSSVQLRASAERLLNTTKERILEEKSKSSQSVFAYHSHIDARSRARVRRPSEKARTAIQ